MPRSIEEIKADIARVQAQIAEQKQVPQPKTNVGWASYIMNDDPHLLDMYQNAERQWNQMQEQNKLTKELAAQNRQEQQMYAMDENMKNRSLAAIKYNYAKQAIANDKSKDPQIANQLAQALAESKAELDYWNKRTGFEAKPEEAKPEEIVPTKVDEPTLKVKTVDYSAIKGFDTDEEQSKTVAELEANPAINTDESLRKELNRMKGLKSKEKVAKEAAVKLQKANDSFAKLNILQKRQFLKDNPEYVAENGKLKFKKKG